jgi:GAF domain-containing protein
MHDQLRLLRTLSAFTADMVSDYDMEDMLERLAEGVTDVLGLAGSGVSLDVDGRLTFVSAVTGQVAQLERLQESLQQGPCVESCYSGEIVAVGDVRDASERWGDYAEVALGLGVAAVAGIPMRLKGKGVGALNLYAGEVREWTDSDLAAAQALADMATAYLANASRLQQQVDLSDQLSRALSSRVVVEQAKGVLAEALGVGVDEAFQRIRSYSRNHNMPLHTVASMVVGEGLRP